MNDIWQRFRAALGLGVIGGIGGAVVGMTWALARDLLVIGSSMAGNVALGGLVWGAFGAFVTAGFAVVLASLGDAIDLDDFPLWQAGLFGAAVGSVFPTAVLYLASGTILSLLFPALPGTAALCALFGGVVASGLVATAKRSDRTLGSGALGEAAALGPVGTEP